MATPTQPPTPVGEARIHCQRCKSENPPSATRCRNCDADLLPGEGAGQRLAYLMAGLLGAALLGFLFYQFHIRNPGSAPDIVICNPAALGVGAVASLVMAFTLALRRTPAYLKFQNRARRHVALNPWQALDDLNRALKLAPEKEQSGLLKQRAELYDKLGLGQDAARDLLALATSPNAFKSQGDWVAALTGADAGVYTHGRRSAQIKSLLKADRARAVGYCPRCKAVVELDAEQRCPVHPQAKGREVQYVIPADVLAGKLAVLQKSERGHSELSAQITELLNSGQAKAVGYCPRCKTAVELDSKRHCTVHPRARARIGQYVVPGDVDAAKRAVLLQGRREETFAVRRRTFAVMGLVAVSITLLLTVYRTQVAEFVERFTAQPPGLVGQRATSSLVTAESRGATALPMITDSATSTPRPSATRTATVTASLPRAVVNTDTLNVRTGPGTNYPKTDVLHKGDQVEVTGRTETGDWLAVTLADGKKGWVAASLVKLDVPVSAIAEAQNTPKPPIPAATSKPAVPKATLTIDEQIATIAKGAHGTLPQPGDMGGVSAGGEAEVTIVNDTPHLLTVLVGSPNSTSITIEACASCKHYSVVGPNSCQEEGRPKRTIRLKPGSSQVVARADDRSVIPFLGTWELKPDTAYFNCFFIVTR